jgi:glucosamine--fructose-6-phosphate aminotransferase (isomerizing)
VAALGEALQGVQSLMIAGRGASLAAAGTGALIIKEAARFPAEGMSSAALRHGPLNMASPRLFTMVYAGEDRFSAMHARLVRDIREAGGKAELVHTAEDRGAFSLPAVPPAGLPLVEILPAQMLSLAAAVHSGWTAGEFTHSSKITSFE